MLARIIIFTLFSCFILWIFGGPEHDGFWSAIYNGITILGRVMFFLLGKPIIWFPAIVTPKIIIGFLIGALVPAWYIGHSSKDE